MMSSHVSIAGSNVAYELPCGRVLFQNLHFALSQQTYGLVGPNGIGKSTFLNLLSGELQPTQGSLSVKGKTAVLPQILQQPGDRSDQRTIADVLGVKEIMCALKQVEAGNPGPEVLDVIGENWDLEDRVQRIFHSLGLGYLALNRSIFQLSGGERVKVYLAKISLSKPDILLLDEPTNNLDESGKRALYEFIKAWQRCLVVVSHDRALLSQVQSILELSDGLSNKRLQLYGGNFDFYLQERGREALALEQKINTVQQEYRRQKADLERSLERQQRRMAQGKKKAAQGGIPKILANGLKRKAQSSLAKLKRVKEGSLAQAELSVQHFENQVKHRNKIQIEMPDTFVHSQKEILELKDFNFRFAEAADFLFPMPIRFYLTGPKRVQISGPNGAGKSTLIKILLQSAGITTDKPGGEVQGTLQLKTDRVGYLDQRLDILGEGTATLLERFSHWTPHLREAERRIRLGRFLFPQESALKKVSVLSGGERMRAALACVLFAERPPELLILDEPTNNLDLDSVEILECALLQFQGALLVISHDSDFLAHIGVQEAILLA